MVMAVWFRLQKIDIGALGFGSGGFASYAPLPGTHGKPKQASPAVLSHAELCTAQHSGHEVEVRSPRKNRHGALAADLTSGMQCRALTPQGPFSSPEAGGSGDSSEACPWSKRWATFICETSSAEGVRVLACRVQDRTMSTGPRGQPLLA